MLPRLRCQGFAEPSAVWLELRLWQAPLLLKTERAKGSDWLRDNWTRWSDEAGELYPPHVLFRKAFPTQRPSQFRSCLTSLPEATASFAGTLWMLLWRATCARPEEAREPAKECLQGLLEACTCETTAASSSRPGHPGAKHIRGLPCVRRCLFVGWAKF